MITVDEYLYYGGLSVALLYILNTLLGGWVIPIVAFNMGASLFTFEKLYVLLNEMYFMHRTTLKEYPPEILQAITEQFTKEGNLGAYGFTMTTLILLTFAYTQAQFVVALVIGIMLACFYEHRRRMLLLLEEVWENIRELD
jgi:hypothetical protein